MLQEDLDLKILTDTYQITSMLKEELAQSGLSLYPKPVFEKIDRVELTSDGEPVVPQDITLLTLTDLGTLYSMTNAYMVFITSQLAVADMEAQISEQIKDIVWSKVRMEAEGTNSTRDDQTRLDARYVRANAQYLLKKTKYQVIREKYRQFESNMKLISRELSRRSLESEQFRIETNFQARPQYPDKREGRIENAFGRKR